MTRALREEAVFEAITCAAEAIAAAGAGEWREALWAAWDALLSGAEVVGWQLVDDFDSADDEGSD